MRFLSASDVGLGSAGRVLLLMFGANSPVMIGTCGCSGELSGGPTIGPETAASLLNTDVGGETTGAGKGDNGPPKPISSVRTVGGNAAGTRRVPMLRGCKGLAELSLSCCKSP